MMKRKKKNYPYDYMSVGDMEALANLNKMADNIKMLERIKKENEEK